jgi:hypothetical protein
MDVVWAGITQTDTLNDSAAKARAELADAAKSYNWSIVLELIAESSGISSTVVVLAGNPCTLRFTKPHILVRQ